MSRRGRGFAARQDSLIVETTTKVMVPVIQIFAFYVIFHGHYSPGGGFQGGALLAGSVLLQRVVLGPASQPGFAGKLAIPFGVVGVLIFFLTGGWAQAQGGAFLQYDALPFPMKEDWLRNTGILMVEIGIGFAVMGVLVSIYDSLVRPTGDEQ